MMMFSICCYDPRVMETLCNLSTDPYETHVKPMMTLVFTDPPETAAAFYEMFDLLQWMNANVRLECNSIHLDFTEYGTSRLLNILLYIQRNYIVTEEKNSFIDGVLYSTTSWMKIPISIKWNENTITK